MPGRNQKSENQNPPKTKMKPNRKQTTERTHLPTLRLCHFDGAKSQHDNGRDKLGSVQVETSLIVGCWMLEGRAGLEEIINLAQGLPGLPSCIVGITDSLWRGFKGDAMTWLSS